MRVVTQEGRNPSNRACPPSRSSLIPGTDSQSRGPPSGYRIYRRLFNRLVADLGAVHAKFFAQFDAAEQSNHAAAGTGGFDSAELIYFAVCTQRSSSVSSILRSRSRSSSTRISIVSSVLPCIAIRKDHSIPKYEMTRKRAVFLPLRGGFCAVQANNRAGRCVRLASSVTRT